MSIPLTQPVSVPKNMGEVVTMGEQLEQIETLLRSLQNLEIVVVNSATGVSSRFPVMLSAENAVVTITLTA